MSGYKLKGQTSVNVLVIVSPTGEAIHASPNYPGATNDARIAQEDAGIRALTSEPRYRDFKYHLFTRNGEKVERTGAYFIADGGFGYDRRLVSTFRVVVDEKDNEGFFNDVHESLRSGVESYFGRLKQRFQIIKNGFHAQDEQKVQLIVRTVLAINNKIMRFDQMNEIGERDNDFCLINCEVKDVGEDVNLNYPTFCRRGQIDDDERVKQALIRFDGLEGQRTNRVDDLGERNDPDDPDHTHSEFSRAQRRVGGEYEHRAKTTRCFGRRSTTRFSKMNRATTKAKAIRRECVIHFNPIIRYDTIRYDCNTIRVLVLGVIFFVLNEYVLHYYMSMSLSFFILVVSYRLLSLSLFVCVCISLSLLKRRRITRHFY